MTSAVQKGARLATAVVLAVLFCAAIALAQPGNQGDQPGGKGAQAQGKQMEGQGGMMGGMGMT